MNDKIIITTLDFFELTHQQQFGSSIVLKLNYNESGNIDTFTVKKNRYEYSNYESKIPIELLPNFLANPSGRLVTTSTWIQ